MHPIRDANFRALLISRIFARLSLGFFDLPFMWWVLDKTGNESMVALVALVGSLVFMLAAPFAGVLADRYRKTKLAAILLFVDGSLTLVAGILFLSGTMILPVALVLLAITNLATALRSPALSSLLPLILEKESYQKGNATMGLANSFAGLVSFALAGIITSIVGVGWTLIIGAIFLFIAIAAILMVNEPVIESKHEADVEEKGKAQNGLWEGFRVVLQSPLLLSITLTITILNLVVSPLNVVLLPYAAKLNAGASGYGYLAAAIVVGEIVGLAVLNILELNRVVTTLVISTMAIGLAMISLSLTHNLLIAILIIVIAGISASVINVQIHTIFQTNIDKEVMGRAYGVLTIISSGAQPLGYAVTGILLASIGLYNILLVSGALLVLTAFIWLKPSTRKALEKA